MISGAPFSPRATGGRARQAFVSSIDQGGGAGAHEEALTTSSTDQGGGWHGRLEHTRHPPSHGRAPRAGPGKASGGATVVHPAKCRSSVSCTGCHRASKLGPWMAATMAMMLPTLIAVVRANPMAPTMMQKRIIGAALS